VEHRVERLEQVTTRHDEQIAHLFKKVDDVNCRLDKIINVMTQIKYAMFGAIGYYLMTEIGFIETLKTIG